MHILTLIRCALLLCSILLAEQALAGVAEKAPRVVTINFHFNSLSNVDNRNETFEADFYVIYRWTDSSLTGKKADEIDWKGIWTPRIESINSDSFEGQWDDVFELIGPARVQLTQRYRGVFKARFDLLMFPFDFQTFPIVLESETDMLDALKLRYQFEEAVDKSEHGDGYEYQVDIGKHIDQTVRLSEWAIKKLKVVERENYYAFDATRWSQFRIEIGMSRKVGFYIWNIVLVVCVIVFLSWTILFLDPLKVTDRLRGVFSLFLSALAFSLVTTTMLPKIPYLTLLDYFLKLNYFLLILTVVESLYAGHLASKDEAGFARAKKNDRYTRIIIPLLFILLSYVIWSLADMKH